MIKQNQKTNLESCCIISSSSSDLRLLFFSLQLNKALVTFPDHLKKIKINAKYNKCCSVFLSLFLLKFRMGKTMVKQACQYSHKKRGSFVMRELECNCHCTAIRWACHIPYWLQQCVVLKGLHYAFYSFSVYAVLWQPSMGNKRAEIGWCHFAYHTVRTQLSNQALVQYPHCVFVIAHQNLLTKAPSVTRCSW